MAGLVSHATLYGHQEAAVRAIHDSKHTLVSTGTGSGKTECFLYPIIVWCLALKTRMPRGHLGGAGLSDERAGRGPVGTPA